MDLRPSAHVDTFCRENLPPAEQWPELVGDLPGMAYPDRLNCATELLAVAGDGPGRPCLRQPGFPVWSYGDLAAASNRVAHVLTEDLGIVPGNRVLLRGPNNQWMTAAWFGAIKAGAVVVTTVALLRAGELSTIDEIARLDAALVDHRFAADVPAAVRTIVYGDAAWDERIAGKPAEYTDVATSSDDVVMLAFTSGTTGRPKATMHFHRDVLAICDTFSRHVLNPSADDVFVGTPPFGFTFGLGGDLLFPLRVGATAVLLEKATPLQLADVIDEYGVTTCFTSPTAYKVMVKNDRTLPSLRAAVSAGEHLPEATWRAFERLTGVRIIDGIGSTEMLHIFIASSGDDIRPGSTGRPVPGYRARIVDDDGHEIPRGRAGHLAVTGPTGCRYLYGEHQRDYVRRGWNITGDTYTQDEDDYFWYQARSDDMIISSGYNIAAPEVEEAILAHPGVVECAVIGIPDEDRGALVAAFVVTGEGVTMTAGDLQDFVKQRIAPYKYPRAVRFVDSLPRTATGKLQRFQLRATAG